MNRNSLFYLFTCLNLIIILVYINLSGDLYMGRALSDVEIYFNYANRIFSGEVPYRSFTIEYPLGVLPIIVAPRLFGTTLETYKISFLVEILAFQAACLHELAKRVDVRDEPRDAAARLAWYTAYSTIMGPLIIGRFDLIPTVMAYCGMRWWHDGRSKVGGTLIALGSVTKLFPGLVAAACYTCPEMRDKRRTRPGLIAFAVASVISAGAWLLLGGWHGVKDSINYVAKRGLEIESFYAGAIMLLDALAYGRKTPIISNYGSHNLNSPISDLVASYSPIIQFFALLVVWVRCCRRKWLCCCHRSTMMIVAFIVTFKVISPQFMIWLMPFVACLGGERQSRFRYLYLLCCVLTILVYPGGGFEGLQEHRLWAIVILNARNLLLLGTLLCLYFAGPPKSPHGLTVLHNPWLAKFRR